MKKGDASAFLLLIFLIAVLPIFSGSPYTLTVGIFSGINALVAIGLCILMGYAGQVSLGQAGFYGIGAYVSSVLSVHAGFPVVVSMICAMVVAAFAAVILAVPALRLKGHYLAVATLGFGEIIYVILNEWGPGGPSGFWRHPPFQPLRVYHRFNNRLFLPGLGACCRGNVLLHKSHTTHAREGH